MKYILSNLIIPVSDEQNLLKSSSKLLKINPTLISSLSISHRAVDTRKKNYPVYVYTLEIETQKTLPDSKHLKRSSSQNLERLPFVKLTDTQPIIIGMGPAGLFCALAMVEKGLQPIIFDRGDELSRRSEKINEFWKTGKLDTESNVQFGEGGAGTFSDGKLTSRSQNIITKSVFDYLIRFGAPSTIKWEALPHLGTDGVRDIVRNIRSYLLDKGCTFNYNSKLEDIVISNDRVISARIQGVIYTPETLILAIGNSARDTFSLLAERKVLLETKPFAVGFRITHSQEWINHAIYGDEKWTEILGAASYRLTSNHSGKGTYTFCMCPGGYVIASPSESRTMVTNGMSNSKRDNLFGNSSVVTSIDKTDYGNKILDGVKFQSSLERSAFFPGYVIPYQTASDYMNDNSSPQKHISCLAPGIESTMIKDIFPPHINEALKKSLIHFDKVLPGFINQGYILAPETRTSSPIRIIRDKINLNCLNILNMYAIGEGAGYSGGIISSAADGFRIGSCFYL